MKLLGIVYVVAACVHYRLALVYITFCWVNYQLQLVQVHSIKDTLGTII